MRHTLLAALLLIPASALAQEEIDIPGVRPDDADRTYTQCFAAPGTVPPAGADLVSIGKNGDRVFMDQYGGVTLWRIRNGQAEVCLVANWTGGAL